MTTQQNLMSGDGWYAAVEGRSASDPDRGYYAAPKEDQAKLRYAPVIAWERYTEADGTPMMRAWLSGQSPIASDRFPEECRSYFINHFVPEQPEGTRSFIWA